MYEQDLLREYINNSELRIFSKEIKVRLSKELAQNTIKVIIIII